VPTKAGTAYVDIVGNFAPLNRQIAHMGGVSAKASSSFSRSMKVVSREAERSRRQVARLSSEVAGIGAVSRVSSRQLAGSLRQVEASCERTLRALRAVQKAQRSVASAPTPGALVAGGHQQSAAAAATAPSLASALVPAISSAAVEAAAAAIARRTASRTTTAGAASLSFASTGLRASGLSVAKSFAKDFAKGLAPGLATAGVEHVLTSALSGNMRDAGFEAGGALVGGLLGSLAGPEGAMLGVGIGSFVGDLAESAFDSIFGSGKKTLTLQERLVVSAKKLAQAYRGTHASAAVMARSGAQVARAHQRVSRAGQEVVAAERRLAQVRRRFGPDSAQATRAERALANARERSARETKKAERANRLHGVELKAAKSILKATTLEERHRINLLNKEETALHKQLKRAQESNRGWEVEANLMGKIKKNQQEVSKARKEQNDTLREATQQVGPKYAKFLHDSTGLLLRTGKQARITRKDLEEPFHAFSNLGKVGQQSTQRAKGGVERLKGALPGFASQAKTQMGKAGNAVKNFDTTTTGALGDVKGQTRRTLVAFGVSAQGFGVRKQKGGAIVPGSGEGDTFHTSLPLGSFVLNKKATAAFGFQGGGRVPVMLEPGERVFMPNEVSQVGHGRLQEMNAAVPRFQSGGAVGGTQTMVLPHIVGPEPLRSLGQKAVEEVFNAAVKLIRREAGSHTYAAVLKEANRIDALHLPYLWGGGHQSSPAPANGPFDCSGAVSRLLQGAGFNIPTMVSGGFESFGDAGKGKVSILANKDHVYSVLGGRAWGTSEENPGGGAGWIDGYTYRPGFALRHADVLDLKVIRGAQGKGQPQKKGYQRGGAIGLQEGGSFTGDINHRYAPHWAPDYSGTTLPGYVIAALAEAAGMPGRTMQQVTLGESGGRPGSAGVDPGGTKGYGLWAITSGVGNDAAINSKYGGFEEMWNPVKNAAAAAEIYAAGGLGRWYGTSHVQADGLHYDGKYDITHALGGETFEEALGRSAPGGHKGPKPVPKVLKGSYDRYQAIGHGDNPDELKGIESHYKVTTSPLHFGGLPDDLKECNKELRVRQRELAEYRAAVHDAKRKATKEALKANIAALEGRVHDLRERRLQLLRKRAASQAVKKITEAANFAHWTAPGGIFEQREDAYNQLQERAEQSISLEPEEPPGGANPQWIKDSLEPYVNNVETHAYEGVLQAQADWRNALLGAEGFAGERVGRWQGQIENLEDHIRKIRALKKDHPQAWEKQKGLIPGMQAQVKALAGDIQRTRSETLPEWEESLEGLQGLARSHEILGTLPGAPTGDFGGSIFETQLTLKDLGLKVSQALAGTTDSGTESERTQLLEELLLQANQRNILRGIEEEVFASMPAVGSGFRTGGAVGLMPPYAGKAHVGAVVPGPPSQERTMIVKGGEGIFTPEQMAALGGGGAGGHVRVHVHGDIVSSHPDPVDVLVGDRRFHAEVRKVTGQDNRRQARGAGRGLATPGVFSR